MKTVLEEFKKVFDDKGTDYDKQTLIARLDKYWNSLNAETRERIGRYRLYNRFFMGDQWWRIERDDDRHKYTNNLCEPTVTKYASLLMGDAPMINIPKKTDLTFDSNIAEIKGFGDKLPNLEGDESRRELIGKVLNKIVYLDNNGKRIFYEGSKTGSLYGDTVFYISYDKKKDTFKFQNVFPGYVRASWAQEDYTQLDYVFIQNLQSVEYVYRKYGVEVPPNDDLVDTDLVWTSRKYRPKTQALIKTYWDQDVCVVYTGLTVLDYYKHDYDRPPFFFIQNRVNPFDPWGMSDLKDVISIQERINIAVSNQSDIIELFANPKVVLEGGTPKDIQNMKNMKGNVLPTRPGTKLYPFEFKSTIFPIQQEVEASRQAFNDVSELPPIFYGTAQGSIVTGVALNAQAAPALQVVNAKGLLWTERLEEMFGWILQVLDNHGGDIPVEGEESMSYGELIDGQYDVEVTITARTPRDDATYIQNEMNKMNFRLQSRTTTMTKLGIKDPDDELKMISYEELNPFYTAKPEVFQSFNLQPGDMDKEAQVAFQEDDRMALGEDVPVPTISLEAHKLHLEIHTQYVKMNPDLDQQILMTIDKHMAGHEKQITQLESKQKNINIQGGDSNQAGTTQLPTTPNANVGQAAQPQLPSGFQGQNVPLPVQAGGNQQQGQ